MSSPQYNPYDQHDTPNDINKNQHLTETERLDKLEKEVCCLRTDLDRIKLEQAIAEAAIGRAIIRGSASLGGCLVIPSDQNSQEKKNLVVENSLMNSSTVPKLINSQFNTEKESFDGTTEKLKKTDKKHGEYFTLG